MIKHLNKINRGLVFFLILLSVVTIYLIVRAQSDKKLQPELQDIASDFVTDAADLVVLPENYREVSWDKGYYDLDAFTEIANSRTEKLSHYYSDNEAIREYSSTWMRMSFMQQTSESVYILSSQPVIEKFGSFSVYKDTATLSFVLSDTITVLVANGREITTELNNEVETITFSKEGDHWVISNYETNRLSYGLWEYNW